MAVTALTCGPAGLPTILASLRRMKEEQLHHGAVHAPSAMEAWLDHDWRLFWNLDILATFRSPRTYLHTGTMNWPNRWSRYLKWRAVGGIAQLLPGEKPSNAWGRMLARIGEIGETLQGYRHLLRLDRELAGLLPSDVHRQLTDVPVGQPFALRIDGRMLTEPLLRHGYYLAQLIRHLPPGFWFGARVLEIGAGYGSLARILKVYAPGLRFVLVDLPERLALQGYHLTHALPNATIGVLEAPPSPELPALDFLLVPTWAIGDLPPLSMALVINTHSFQEMKNMQVRYYLEHVHRLSRSFFYCVNRFEKQIGEEVVRHPRTLLDGSWETVFEQPQPHYPRILAGLYRRKPGALTLSEEQG